MADDPQPAPPADPVPPSSWWDRSMAGLEGSLLRYRILAYVVGVGLVVLVFIGMPIQFWAHSKAVVAVVGPIHGILYIVYLAAALELWRRTRWNLIQLLAVVGAGFVPFLAFVVERYTTRRVREQLAAGTVRG